MLSNSAPLGNALRNIDMTPAVQSSLRAHFSMYYYYIERTYQFGFQRFILNWLTFGLVVGKIHLLLLTLANRRVHVPVSDLLQQKSQLSHCPTKRHFESTLKTNMIEQILPLLAGLRNTKKGQNTLKHTTRERRKRSSPYR